MSRVKFLRQQRENPTSIFLQFKIKYNKDNNDIYVFFEGKDDCPYYMPELRRRWNGRGKIHHYDCNGKDNVIALYKKVKKVVNNISRTLFFIDKDFDDIIGIKKPSSRSFYRTKYYSIENNLINEDIFEMIWTDIFHLNFDDNRYEKYRDKLKRSINEYHIALKPIMAWVIYNRDNNIKITLQDVNLKKVISFPSSTFKVKRKKLGFRSFVTSVGVSSTESLFNIRKYYRLVDNKEPKVYMRGKYEMWFFVSFINKVADIVKNKVDGYERAKIRQSINSSNVVEILAARVPYPSTLNTFLDYNLSRI